MRISQAVVPALLGLFLAGCRSDPSRDLLERDNFHKEQEIYRLKNRIEDLEEQLNAATGPQAATRPAMPGEASPQPRAIEGVRPGAPVTRPGPALLPPERQPEESAAPGLTPLEVSPGMETPSGEIPKTFRGPAGPPGHPPAGGGASVWRRSNVQLASGNAPIDNRPVAQITLHPSLTGGIGNSAAGDEGLLVVVEPRDFAGNIVPVPGDTSAALIDPALSGEEARLARWDFTAAQTERLIHTGSEPGIHLRLMWRSLPEHDRLKVFVRYTTRDGRKLQAERIIAVATGTAGLHPEADNEVGTRSPHPDLGSSSHRRASEPRQIDPPRPQWSPERD